MSIFLGEPFCEHHAFERDFYVLSPRMEGVLASSQAVGIGRTMYETDKVPASWVPRISRMDQAQDAPNLAPGLFGAGLPTEDLVHFQAHLPPSPKRKTRQRNTNNSQLAPPPYGLFLTGLGSFPLRPGAVCGQRRASGEDPGGARGLTLFPVAAWSRGVAGALGRPSPWSPFQGFGPLVHSFQPSFRKPEPFSPGFHGVF